MLPTTHHGAYRGQNRLWFDHESPPQRSEAELVVEASGLRYTWVFQEAPQQGQLTLHGPLGAHRAEWTDTFHAAGGMILHGCATEGLHVLYGTYPDGQGGDWGWRLELDTRDPAHFVVRMFNLAPSGPAQLAVDLRCERVATHQ